MSIRNLTGLASLATLTACLGTEADVNRDDSDIATTIAALETTPVEGCGDLDGNGTVNVSDGVLALRVAAQLEVLTWEKQARADVTGDGVITVSDAVSILRQAAGLSSPIACRRPLFTAMYSQKILPEDVELVASWGLDSLMEYYTAPDTLNHVSTSTEVMQSWMPVYFHGCAQHQLGKENAAMTRADFVTCLQGMRTWMEPHLDRVAGIYLFDEPELDHAHFTYEQQAEAIDACHEVFPGKPTMIAYLEDDYDSPPGLDYRGIQLYETKAAKVSHIKDVLDENAAHCDDPQTKLVPIAVAAIWDKGSAWEEDEELENLNQNLIPYVVTRPDVGGVMWYIWGDVSEDTKDQNLNNLPKTQAVIRDALLSGL